MKIKAVFLSLLFLVSPGVFAWEQLTPSLYAIYGTKIDQSKPSTVMMPFAEIVYDKDSDNFGISFINSNGVRQIVRYGIFNMRTCGINTTGAISGTSIIDIPSRDQMDNLFIDCKRPMFFRVWDTANEHVTYKFENAGPLPE